MMQSYVIDVAGTFAGAAIRTSSLQGESFRFVAVDPRVRALDQSEFPSLDAVRHTVARVLRTSRPPAAVTPPAEPVPAPQARTARVRKKRQPYPSAA
ncbi:MAG TPA: hypothetical protein VMA86_07260 [Acetobacteraceae bacterium]|nr:hypothetical protein [Acetobacteraceae bacterium]